MYVMAPDRGWQNLRDYKLTVLQGRVRTKTVKKTAANIVEKYYQKLAMDFDNNKRVRFAESCDGQIVDECADFPSKRMRNKIAGYVTVAIVG